MKANPEKRTCDRHRLKADVMFSYFNKEPSYFAQTQNLGSGGMCFCTSLLLKPGSTVCIRLKKVHADASGAGCCEGLRSITLGQVQWCHEVSGFEAAKYSAGIKYLEPTY
jgi:hypothetical protein